MVTGVMDIYDSELPPLHSELLLCFALIGVAHVFSGYFWGHLSPAHIRVISFAIAFPVPATIAFCQLTHITTVIAFAIAATMAFWF